MTRTHPSLLLTLAAGFTAWAAGFVLIYGLQGLGCSYGWDMIAIGPISLLRTILIALTLIGTLITYLLARGLAALHRSRDWPETESNLLSIANYAAYFAVPATFVTFSGVFIASACN